MENEDDFSKNLIENKDVIHKHTIKTIFLKNRGKQKCHLINRQQRGFFVKKIKNKDDIPRNTVENKDFCPQNILENKDDFR